MKAGLQHAGILYKVFEVLATIDLVRLRAMPGDQNVISPSWLQATNDPSDGTSRMRSTGSRWGIVFVLAGSWKPTWRARRYESSISAYSSCMYVQNSSHVIAPCDAQSIFRNNASICASCVHSPLNIVNIIINIAFAFYPRDAAVRCNARPACRPTLLRSGCTNITYDYNYSDDSPTFPFLHVTLSTPAQSVYYQELRRLQHNYFSLQSRSNKTLSIQPRLNGRGRGYL